MVRRIASARTSPLGIVFENWNFPFAQARGADRVRAAAIYNLKAWRLHQNSQAYAISLANKFANILVSEAEDSIYLKRYDIIMR